jgi:hypothetical protein
MDDIVVNMKPISLSVSNDDYEAFRKAARERNTSIAQLIRDAMLLYRTERLERRTPLEELPLLTGHRPVESLPSRAELYDEVFARD